MCLTQVVLVYNFFMLCVQLVLLNLLIAIMGATHERVRGVAELVARFERAKLVLEEEEKIRRWQKPQEVPNCSGML